MTASTNSQGFQDWIGAFSVRAEEAGITPEILAEAFQNVAYSEAIVEQDRNQNEFTKQIWDYLDTAVSAARIANGQRALEENRQLLNRIERRYGVEQEIVLAIWGLESAYGGYRGNISTFDALATLAFDGRRAEFFETELMAALRILQLGETSAENMRGSWAGAMGHTQFMPTSYLTYAEDYNRDGRRDIWGDDPADALASTAAYLAHFGWTSGQPWGMEVILPDGFDFTNSSERVKKSVSEWMRLGVRDINGDRIADYGPASVLVPAGADGAAFLIFDNFHVLERYNTADAYVIGVGHLADRIMGGAAIQATWPRGDRALSFDEKRELQQLLLDRGFDPHGVDGIMGPDTIAAIRAYQASVGQVPDGYASIRLIEQLR